MKVNEKLQTAKQGVNLIRTIVDNSNCFFHEIQQENDLGIDAIIELSNKGIMTGLNIAVQIKTGTSYINYDKRECSFPIGNHVSYWASHALPVYGFVCDLDQQCYYYVDIKNYISIYKDEIKNGTIKSVTFEISYFNTISSENFENLFKNTFLRIVPLVSYEDAEALILSNSVNDIDLGLRVLRKYYYQAEKTWDIFLNIFRDDRFSFFHTKIIDYFSYGTDNPDIFTTSDDYEICSIRASEKFLNMSKSDVIKLLGFVDEEIGFQRGSMGEWVDFIIHSIPNNIKILADIVNDRDQIMNIRENALFLIACYDPKAFLNLPLKTEFTCYRLLEKEILQHGAIYPYS